MRILLGSFLTLAAGAVISFMLIPPENVLKDVQLYAETKTTGIALIDTTPQGIWLTGGQGDYGRLTSALQQSTASNTVPVIVLYNIPKRDCDSFSAGGATNGQMYRQWINSVANELKDNRVILIIEPDALADLDCLNGSEQIERTELIKYAVTILSQDTTHYIYIDAGHPQWKSVKVMTERLHNAGIEKAQGFSLNISNYFTNKEVVDYGKKISYQLAGKKTFIIDTSRNGNGPQEGNEWCNPRGRALGTVSTTTTNLGYVDALIWIKNPGESDGECNGGPSAGTFWPEYAQELITNIPK